MNKRWIALLGWLLFCATLAAPAQNLDAVLTSMDHAAASFHLETRQNRNHFAIGVDYRRRDILAGTICG